MSRSAAVVTVSDGVSTGTRADASGDAAQEALNAAGFDVVERVVVADELEEIGDVLEELARKRVALVVTTGGTGFGPRDVTPEATKRVVDREAPGLAEVMRAAGISTTPMAALSRGIAGARDATLIVNLPGSTKGVRESLEALLPVIPHALELLEGHTEHAGDSAGESPQADAGNEERAEGDLVVATAVRTHGAPPCKPGQKAVFGHNGPVEGTLGCAEFDSAATKDAPTVIQSGEPLVRTYEHDLGSVEVFLELRPRTADLLVVAATPVAAELLALGRSLGYRTLLLETRAERVTSQHRRRAREVLLGLGSYRPHRATDAIHTDHDAPDLVDTLETLLRSPARFIGVMGSARHVAPHLDELKKRGFTDADLDRIRTPVGLDIGARSPAEIALSIAAGLVAAKEDRSGGWLDG